ncbi:hypothetical protein GALMADRAFT_141855 [Galerina marginata CBS 339.88]|uniref:Fungal-type protein kinase domain-containing protein n=1 Tax=Galerina marginata (strain CBS 339.88) TaxID=685588 RepID=A0A067STA8_GALM3|nr:hypothetical protein GALMADRAFT_141855 [Galerina marginata CBS 339.88]
MGYTPPNSRKQEELEAMAGAEYRGAVWQGIPVLDAFCPESPLTKQATQAVRRIMGSNRQIAVEKVHTNPYRVNTDSWSSSWPTTQHESISNAAFISLLTEVGDALQEQHTPPYFGPVTFVDCHDKTTLDGVESSSPLKPDGGVFRSKDVDAAKTAPVQSQIDRFHWRQFLIAIEVKKNDKDLLAQAFTYARAMFVATDRRWFSPVITFNFRTTEVHFTFWTRWAMYATAPFKLNTQEGFDHFVDAIIRMLMWKDEEATGMFSGRNEAGLWLDGLGLLQFEMVLNYRACARGRASHVFLARNVLPRTLGQLQQFLSTLDIPTLSPSLSLVQPSGRESPPLIRRSMRLLKSREAKPPSQPPLKPSSKSGTRNTRLATNSSKPSDTGFSRSTSMPTSIQEESSEPAPANRTSPGSNIEAHGPNLPSVMDAIVVEGPTQGVRELQEIHRHLWKNSPDRAIALLEGRDRLKEWATLVTDQFSKGQNNPKHYVIKEGWVGKTYNEAKMFEDTHRGTTNGAFGVAKVKVYVRSAPVSKVEGVQPWDIFDSQHSSEQEERSFVTLVAETVGTSLIHATGPNQLVTAILHAIIGHYNILSASWLHCDVSIGNIILVPDGEMRDTSKWLGDETKCIGFMIDGDLAIQWEDLDRIKASSKSGTPPFMSARLLDLLTRSTDTPIIHSFRDDLEGYAWVLLWAAISAEIEDERAADWLQMLDGGDNYKNLRQAKTSIMYDLLAGGPEQLPIHVRPLVNLLVSLFDALRKDGQVLDQQLIKLHDAKGDQAKILEVKAAISELTEKMYGCIIGLFRHELDNGNLPKTWAEVRETWK